MRLIGVHNRPHGLFDLGNPARELDDPPIGPLSRRARPARARRRALPQPPQPRRLADRPRRRARTAGLLHDPQLLADLPAGLPADRHGRICAGPGDAGGDCAACVGSHDVDGHQRRLAEIRARAERGLTAILAVSAAVRDTLLAAGYPPELVDVVRQAMPHETEIWEQVGRDAHAGPRRRAADRRVPRLRLPAQGPPAARRGRAADRSELRVQILGEVPDASPPSSARSTSRGVVELVGAFSPSEIGALLADVDVARAPVDVVGLRTAGGGRVPRGAGAAASSRGSAGSPRRFATGSTGSTFDGLDADDLARQLDRLAGEPGLLERLQAAIGAPRRSPPTSTSSRPTTRASGRAAERERTPAARALAVRWQGDHGLPTSLSIINDRVTERLPGPVQRLPRDGAPAPDPPLPHAADVEVRHQWPPDLASRAAPVGWP